MAKKQTVKEKNIWWHFLKPLKNEEFVICQEEKTQGMISLSLEKDCTFENLSEYSQFTFKFSCVVGLLLCNRTLPFILKIFSVIFHFPVCFCLTSPHYTQLSNIFLCACPLRTHQIFTILSFSVNSYIIFFRIYAPFFLVENDPVTYIFPIWRDWKQTSKAKCGLPKL